MTKTTNLPSDPDLANVEKALIRAGQNALQIALQTNTPCYIYENGKIVDIARRTVMKEAKDPGTTAT